MSQARIEPLQSTSMESTPLASSIGKYGFEIAILRFNVSLIQQPEKAKELAAKWEAWALRAQVKPYPDKGKGEKKGAGKRKGKAAE